MVFPDRLLSVLSALVLLSPWVVEPPSAQERSLVASGSYHSLFPEVEGEEMPVSTFYLDTYAVSNDAYHDFVMTNPSWSRERASKLFVSDGYLKHWEAGPVPEDRSRPVTNVSWYAAASYCEWAGGRLPTMEEWEYAAQRLELQSEAEWDRAGSDILGWVTSVDPRHLPRQGESGVVTLDGVHDLHHQTLEWVEDFRPPIADGISFDCGTAGRMTGEGDRYRYASVIRTLTRMSMRPETTTGTLGFRCAYDASAMEVGGQ